MGPKIEQATRNEVPRVHSRDGSRKIVSYDEIDRLSARKGERKLANVFEWRRQSTVIRAGENHTENGENFKRRAKM